MPKGKKQQLSVVGTVVTVTYPTIQKSVSVDFARLVPEVQLQTGLHGLGQKLGDAESGGTPAEKFEMASRIVDALNAGNWNLAVKVDNTAIIAEGISRVKKVTLKQALDLGVEKLKEYGLHPRIKAEVAKIRAERAAAAAAESDAEELEIKFS